MVVNDKLIIGTLVVLEELFSTTRSPPSVGTCISDGFAIPSGEMSLDFKL